MSFVAVVDYGMGNLDSVRRALEVCGAIVVVTSDPADLADADRIVLPGVGAFGVAMDNLRSLGLDAALAEQVVDLGAPFLGICLGMQLMASRSTEHGDHVGLGWIAGTVDRLVPTDDGARDAAKAAASVTRTASKARLRSLVKPMPEVAISDLLLL